MGDHQVSGVNTDAPLTLTTLGGFCLGAQAVQTPIFTASKPLALIAFLSCSPGQAGRREQLIDLLWADLAPADAAHAFRQTLWYIRQKCGQEFIRTVNGSVQLGTPPLSDRDTFLNAIERHDLTTALAVYQGDFLPEFAAPGGADFEHWADIERQRLRDIFARTAEAQARQLLGTPNAREAVALARRICALHPSHPPGHRLLLEALASSGDWLTASSQADQLERILQAEGREPDAATRAALSMARQKPVSGHTGDAAPQPVSEMVGREAEFQAIVAGWAAVCRGGSSHVQLVAGAGLGKTRLLHDAGNRLRAQGARVVMLRANPGEGPIAGCFVADVALELSQLPGAMSISPAAAGTLLALNPALSSRYGAATPDHSAGPDAVRRRILALTELAVSVAEEAPFALLLDDLHWADQHSLQVLGAVLARLAANQALVLTTTRPVAEGIIERPDTITLALKPLSVADAAALMASLGTLPEEAWASTLAQKLHQATGGNPLLLLETLQLAAEREALCLGDAGWRSPRPDQLAEILREGGALRRRVVALDRNRQWLLLLMAVAGSPMEYSLLGAVTRRPADAVRTDLAALERAGLVQRSGSSWQPAHDAIADMAIETSPAEALQAAHASLGRVLAESGDGSHGALVRAVRHLLLARADDDAQAAYRHLVQQAAINEPSRPPEEWAAQLTGEKPSSPRVRALVRTLPLPLRYPMLRWWRAAAVLILLLAGAGTAAAALRSPPKAEARLITFQPAGEGFRAAELPLVPSNLVNGDTLDLSSSRPVRGLPISRRERGLLPQPRGSFWASWDILALNDSQPAASQDLAILGNGRAERLLPAAGDDGPEAWSPDGRLLLFYTDRTDNQSQGDQAIVDYATGRWWLLAPSPARDVSGSWSPDGTRVAWLRTWPTTGQPNEICWATMDGTRVRCDTSALEISGLRGWLNESEVLAEATDSSGVPIVVRVAIDIMRVQPVFEGSADGRAVGGWILCRCRARPGESSRLAIRNVMQPDLRFPVILGDQQSTAQLVAAGDARRPYLERLMVEAPPGDTLELGATLRLRVQGFDADGTPIAVSEEVISWRSSDPSTIAVDSSGVIAALRPGTARIQASAGGWRYAGRVLRVVAPTAPIAQLEESWDERWLQNWRTFGEPRPVAIHEGRGNAFWHHGDSTFTSGAYTVRSWSAQHGLLLRMLVSAEITDTHWQSLVVGFRPISDTARLAAWNHTTGDFPFTAWDADNQCEFAIPPGEGLRQVDRIGLAVGRTRANLVTAPELRRRPFELLLQIMPDGYCVAQVDGRIVLRSVDRIEVSRPFHVCIFGQSHRTRMLAGPLTVATGVAPELRHKQPSAPQR